MAPMSKTLAPSQSVVTQRDPKGRKFMEIVGQQLDKAALSDGPDGEAQRINDLHLAELADLIANFIAEARLTDKFKDEEVKSNYTYPNEYKGPKPIEEQINGIARIFGLDPTSALEYAKQLPALDSFVPAHALRWTGWFAFPSVDVLTAKYFPEVTDQAEKYCRALQLLHQKIADSRRFYNYREGQITPDHLRLHARTAQALATLAEMQKGDILIIAAQVGMLHRGRSTRRAREVFVSNEYGLNSVMGCAITLTHPERFVRWEQLHMDLPGDEFCPNAGGRFSGAPFLDFSDDGVKFYTNDVDLPLEYYGSGSWFLPQLVTA
jgi:hypothetical protein